MLPTEASIWQRPIPVAAIILLALAIHGPLLVMELPATTSYDANLHIFFASHYAHHWFDPWNEKWFAGFSQTTYPPLTHQWIALLSYIVGLTEAFMLVQLAAVVLLAVGAYRFAQLWVNDRAASYAGVLAVFAGSIAFLVYSAGQLPTTLSAPLYFLALPYFYSWCRSASWRSLLKGIALTLAAASAHHVTLIFGSVLFALPVLWLAWYDGAQKETIWRPHHWPRSRLRRDFGGWGWDCSVALLDCDHPPSHRAVAHSARQPFELVDELDLRDELLHRSVWCLDPGIALHRDQGRIESALANAAAGVLGHVSDCAGRYNSGSALDIWPSLRNSHLRTIHALGNGAGTADCGIVGGGSYRPLPALGGDRRQYGCRCQPGAGAGLADLEPVSHVQLPQRRFRRLLSSIAMATISIAISRLDSAMLFPKSRLTPTRTAWMASTTRPACCPS